MTLIDDFNRMRSDLDDLRERLAREAEQRAILEDRLRDTADVRARVARLESIRDAAGGEGTQVRSGLGQEGGPAINFSKRTLKRLARDVPGILAGDEGAVENAVVAIGRATPALAVGVKVAELVKRFVDEQVEKIVKAKFAELDAAFELRFARIQAEFERQNSPEFLSAQAREIDRTAALLQANGLAHQSEYPGFGD